MTHETKHVRTTRRGGALLAALALGLSGAAFAPGPPVAPPSSTPYDTTYGEWAAAWWQWALGQPAATNPVLDPTGEFCAMGQTEAGPVWFLAGTFGGNAERTCTVPGARALLIPVLNAGFFAFVDDPPETRTEEFLRAQVSYIEGATGLFATVDGRAVPNVARWLEKSVLFTVVLPEGNVFGLPAGFVLDPSVDEGFYLLLPPLAPGAHTITFGGTAPGSDPISVTYHLTIAR